MSFSSSRESPDRSCPLRHPVKPADSLDTWTSSPNQSCFVSLIQKSSSNQLVFQLSSTCIAMDQYGVPVQQPTEGWRGENTAPGSARPFTKPPRHPNLACTLKTSWSCLSICPVSPSHSPPLPHSSLAHVFFFFFFFCLSFSFFFSFERLQTGLPDL